MYVKNYVIVEMKKNKTDNQNIVVLIYLLKIVYPCLQLGMALANNAYMYNVYAMK